MEIKTRKKIFEGIEKIKRCLEEKTTYTTTHVAVEELKGLSNLVFIQKSIFDKFPLRFDN